MNTFCRLMQIPKWMRIFLGWILLGIGLPLFITPIPGGFILGTAGAMLLFCASPSLRNCLWRWVKRYPKLSRRLAPLFSSCNICLNACQTHPPTNGISPVSVQSVSISTASPQEEKFQEHDKNSRR